MSDFPDWAKPFIAIYENSPAAVLILDEALEMQWANKTAKNKASSTGKLNWADCLIRAKENGLLPRLQRGESFTLANPLLFAPPVHYIFQPQLDESGHLQGVLVQIFPSADTGSSEWQDSMYQPANVFNNQFRTPLSQIFSVLNLLQSEYQNDRTLQKYLGNINWYCYRILRTINNFSMDQRILAGQLNPKMLTGDLCRFMRTLCKDLEELLQNTAYSFSYDIPDESFVTVYDGDLLSCAVCNLVSNACKFTDPQNGRIVLKMTVLEKQITITVSDNGCGMSPQVLKHATERFYSHDPLTGVPCGDGLGLFVCRFILQLHHGTLAFHTEEGAGTTAALTIPMAKSKEKSSLYDDPVSFSQDRFSRPYILLSDVIPPDTEPL